MPKSSNKRTLPNTKTTGSPSVTRTSKKQSLTPIQALAGTEPETDAEVPLPISHTVVNVVQQIQPGQDEEDGKKSETVVVERQGQQQQQQEDSHGSHEIAEINKNIAKIEADIVATQEKLAKTETNLASISTRVVEWDTEVTDANAALTAFKRDNLSVQELFKSFPFTMNLILPSQGRDDQVMALMDHVKRRDQLRTALATEKAALATEKAALATEKAALINLLHANHSRLAEEKAKLQAPNQKVPLQSPGDHRVVQSEPVKLSIKSNRTSN